MNQPNINCCLNILKIEHLSLSLQVTKIDNFDPQTIKILKGQKPLKMETAL
jgi:hypothetical protein